MSEFENFEKKDIGKEILTEWYQEKGLPLTDSEKKELEKKEEVSTPFFTPQVAKKTKDDFKKEEEKKKLEVKSKIKNLLAIGEKKGLQYSIKEARKENDPFLIDLYHDVLAKDKAYKKFLKR